VESIPLGLKPEEERTEMRRLLSVAVGRWTKPVTVREFTSREEAFAQCFLEGERWHLRQSVADGKSWSDAEPANGEVVRMEFRHDCGLVSHRRIWRVVQL
jgi:hypothetical protein